MALAGGAVPAQAEELSAPAAIATGLAIPVGSAPTMHGAAAGGRMVLVDAASARLYMIENGVVRDSMRVIVGKPASATPVMRSTLHYATLNPYWNVPTDLARDLIAPKVLAEGISYLADRGYEVVSAFASGARTLDPASVDWHAVADGRATVRVRQRPGPANSMGRVKFGFANDDGIFLHDTPRKELFAQDQRNISNGCVRLEDADRLARWLLGTEPPAASQPEQHVALPRGVPLIITYLDRKAPLELAALR